MLVVDHATAPAFRPVVVISRQAKKVRLQGAVLDPPVKVEDARLIAVYDFAAAKQPVIQVLLIRLRLAEQVLMAEFRLGGPIEVTLFERLPDIAVKRQ